MFRHFVIGVVGFLIVSTLFILGAGPGLAQTTPPPAQTVPTTPPTKPGSSNCQPGQNGETVCTLENPIASGETDVTKILGQILKAAVGVVGAIALLMFIWGGVTWLISGGSEEKVKKGAQTMLWAAVGVLVVLGSYFLIDLVFRALTGQS